MSLYHKYRPMHFEELVGNEDTVRAVQTAVKQEDGPHVYLFHGHAGTGKTTMGRLVAQALDVSDLDFCEMNSAHYRGIDTVRAMLSGALLSPLGGDKKLVLLDECHQLSKDAQTALLKGLEDPPCHMYYVLCTTDPKKLSKPLRDRCAQFEMRKLHEDQVAAYMDKVADWERAERLSGRVMEELLRRSDGCMRPAMQMLDRLLFVSAQDRDRWIENAEGEDKLGIDLCRALFGRGGWQAVSSVLVSLKQAEADPERVRMSVLGYAQGVLLKNAQPKAALALYHFGEPFWDSGGFPGLTLACWQTVVSK